MQDIYGTPNKQGEGKPNKILAFFAQKHELFSSASSFFSSSALKPSE